MLLSLQASYKSYRIYKFWVFANSQWTTLRNISVILQGTWPFARWWDVTWRTFRGKQAKYTELYTVTICRHLWIWRTRRCIWVRGRHKKGKSEDFISHYSEETFLLYALAEINTMLEKLQYETLKWHSPTVGIFKALEIIQHIGRTSQSNCEYGKIKWQKQQT